MNTENEVAWHPVLRRLFIWLAFIAFVCLIRKFFFLAFMTFLFSYVALAIVDAMMKRLAPNGNRPGLRRLVTAATFMVFPIAFAVLSIFIAPKLLAQAQNFAGWISQVNPETEVTNLLEHVVGPIEFRKAFGSPEDARFQKAIDEFRETGDREIAAYMEFPKLESWLESGFNRQFDESERNHIKARLMAEGTSSKEFQSWLESPHSPELQSAIEQARHDPGKLGVVRKQWIDETVARELEAAKKSPMFLNAFRTYYDRRKHESPKLLPFTFDQYLALKKARPQGRHAFGEVLEGMKPSADIAGVQADFEAAKKRELFETWWATSTTAQFIRHQFDSGLVENAADRVERWLSSLLNMPIDLATAMLLSLFICIDFPRLSTGVGRLRQTWVRGVYHELAPALSSLAMLVGKAMLAQGMIAGCNAIVVFFALTILGVEHAVLLGGAVFVLCLIPTFGMILAWTLLVVIALVQPGGGFMLAAKVTAAVAIVIAMETFVFSPRIMGRVMELHPVVIITLLPIAQYFFGIWGLILATPVAVFVINVVIFGNDQPETASAVPERR